MRCRVVAASAIARAKRGGRTRDERSAGDRGGSSWRSAEPLELAIDDGNDDPRGVVHLRRGAANREVAIREKNAFDSALCLTKLCCGPGSVERDQHAAPMAMFSSRRLARSKCGQVSAQTRNSKVLQSSVLETW